MQTTQKSLWEKLAELLNSPRFWMVTLGAIATGIKMKTAGTLDVSGFLTLVQGYIGTVAGIGMVDKIVEKMGGTKTQ